MKTVKFVPKSCAEQTLDDGTKVPAKFKGCVTLRVPNFFERQKLKTILMGAVITNGETDIEAIKLEARKVNLVDLMGKMGSLIQESVDFYQLVEIENIESGAFHKSFDDLSCDKDAEPIIQEVAQELANGFSLSKNS